MNIELHLLLMPIAGVIFFVFIKFFAPLAEARRLIEAVPPQRGRIDVWVVLTRGKRCSIDVVDEADRTITSTAECISSSKPNFQYKGPAEFYFHPQNKNRFAVKAADCVLLLNIR